MISDMHLTERNFVCRKDNVSETQFVKLNFVFRWARENGAIIVSAGDVFDKSRGYKVLGEFLKQNLPVSDRFFASAPSNHSSASAS